MLSAAVALCFTLTGCGDQGQGEKNGTITKLANTGLFCKTWEAEIIRGGLNSGSGVIGAAFDFTIEDDALLKKVQQAFDQQREVRIHYRTEVVTFCRSDSSDHFLTSIEFVAPGQGGTVNDSAKRASNPSAGAVSAEDIKKMLDQNQQAIDQNKRLIDIIEKKL